MSAGFDQAFIVLGFLTLVGVLLLWLGLRGRRVGDHPYCRQCGFDLFGRNQDSYVCSECGSHLRLRKAIVIGARRLRYGLILPGLLIIIASLSWSGWQLKDIDPTPYKPDWWITREARSPDATTRIAAILELTRRLNNGGLSGSRVSSLVSHALDVQADQTQTWLPEWGDFVQESFAAQLASDEQWERYIRQAIDIKLDVRARVRKGDPLPVTSEQRWTRLGRKPIDFFVNDVRAEFTEKDYLLRGWNRSTQRVGDGWNDSFNFGDHIDHLQPGTHSVTLHRPILTWYTTRVARKFEITSRATWELLPDHQPSVRLVRSPKLKAEAERSLRVFNLQQDEFAGHRRFTVNLSIAQRRSPLAHDVVIRTPDREGRVGLITSRDKYLVGGGLGLNVPTEMMKDLKQDKVDIVLKPNPSAAAESIHIFELPDEELVWKDVAVHSLANPSRANQSDLDKLNSNLLSDDEISQIVDKTLIHSETPATRFHPNYSNFIVQAQMKGKLHPEKWEHYLRKAADYQLKVREKVSKGDPLPFQFDLQSYHWFLQSGITWRGKILLYIDDRFVMGLSKDNVNYGVTDSIPRNFFEWAEPGQHTLRLVAEIHAVLPDKSTSSVKLERESSFTIVPSHESTVRLMRDGSLDAALRAAVRLEAVLIDDDPNHVNVFLDLKKPPAIQLAFKVALRANGKQYRCGKFISSRKGWNESDVLMSNLRDYVDKVDVILTSDIEAAERTIDIVEIWDGEIVLKDVPVKIDADD